MSEKTERELLEEISGKLSKVLAIVAIQGRDRESQIELLSALGFDSADIGRLVGLSAGAVRTYRSRQRRGS